MELKQLYTNAGVEKNPPVKQKGLPPFHGDQRFYSNAPNNPWARVRERLVGEGAVGGVI